MSTSASQDIDPRLRNTAAAGPVLAPSNSENSHVISPQQPQNIYPYTPQSAGNRTSDHGGDGGQDGDGGANDPKRPRACEGEFPS